MKYLNYDLVNITIPQLIEKTKHITSQMKGNPHFPKTYPSLPEIESINEDLCELNQKVDEGNSNQIPLLQEKFVCLKRKLKQLGTYVAIKAQGNLSIVQSSGFQLSDHAENENSLYISS